MMRFFEKETRLLILIVLLFLGIQMPIYILVQEGVSGLFLIVFLLLLITIALLGGPAIGLFSSLIFIFLVGSFLFYFALSNTSLLTSYEIPLLSTLLGYGFSLIIFVMIAGQIHNRIIEQGKEERRLADEIKQFVAVDVDTGFDNKHRMALEIDAEMQRINRYGGTFTLILFQIDFYHEFVSLYGEKEHKNLLQSLSNKVREKTRSTDLKFRYAADRFALLLTNTSEESIEIVYAKLSESIKTHQLLTGKYITLSYRIGHVSYDKEGNLTSYKALFEQVESEMITHEL